MTPLQQARKLLEHLGYNLTPQEHNVFGQLWKTYYTSGNAISAMTELIYAIELPACLSDNPEQSLLISTMRQRDFNERMSRSGVLEKLSFGDSLQDIIKGPPHTFLVQKNQTRKLKKLMIEDSKSNN